MQDEQYKKAVIDLREIRLQNRLRFHNASSNMANLLNSIKDNPFQDRENPVTIDYFDLKNCEPGVWLNVDENASFRLVEANEDNLKFSAVLKAGGKFALTRHNSMHSISINQGRLIDLVSNKIYDEGSQVIYLEYEPHEHASDIYSEYTIYFHNPKK